MMLTACVWIFAGALLHAQMDDPAPKSQPESEAPNPPSSAGVREVKPETYVVRDADGRFVPMLNMSLEEIQRLVELELQSSHNSSPPPAYTLQELLITGTADATRADLRVEATIRLQQDGWVRIPLRFSDAILREPAEFDGAGEAFVRAEEDTGAYVCWIRASQDQPHRVSMKFAVPVRQLGSESRLALQVPRAASSSLDLRVPVADVHATASNGLLEIKKVGSETQLLVTGLTPDFQVAWTAGDAAPIESRSLLKADIRTLIKVNDLHEISGEVNLSVENLRGGFDSFTVSLPPGTVLSPRQPTRPEYRITDLGGQDETRGTRLQVKLEKRAAQIRDVQLLTTLSPVANGKIAEFEAGGVEVEDAIGQTQTIDFFVEGDLSVNWRPGPNVQRTIVPDDAKDAIEARFESVRRSPSLRFQVSPHEALISVDPLYVLHLESDRIRLSATLHYKIRRTSAYGVNVYCPKWRIDQVLPETVVDSPSLDRDKRDPLYIPLKASAIQENGEFTLQIEGVYEADPTDGVVSVVLPRPEGKMLTAATVAVLPADNVALTVVEEQLQGLERESFPPDIDLPQRQQSPLFFRERSDGKSAVFAAEIGRRERSVSISPSCRIEISGPRIRVWQTLDYKIAYEKLRFIELTAPRYLIQPENLRILEGEHALPFVVLADQSGDAEAAAGQTEDLADGDQVRLQVDLLSDRIGQWAATIEYELPLPQSQAESPNSIRVPLVLPVTGDDTALTSCRLDIRADEDQHVRVTGGNWEAVDDDSPDLAGTLVSRFPPSHVELLLDKSQGGTNVSTVVRKAWFQTWLQSQHRRDRAVFQVSTTKEQIEILLPADARLEYVALDGRLVESDLDSLGRRVTIKMGDAGELKSSVVELWYGFSGGEYSSGTVGLEPAVIAESTWSSRMYWSLATPSTDHLLLLPRGATPEMSWAQRGVFRHRVADLDQVDLERWIGASRQQGLPASLNNYLFSSFGETRNLQCTLGSRSMILLIVSGSALLAGLLLIHVRILRHPAVVFVGGLILVSTVLLYPDLATAVCQASFLGIGLVLSALLLKWIADWRQARRSVVRGATFASPDSKTVKAAAVPLNENHPHTPPTTASMSLEEPVGEASA